MSFLDNLENNLKGLEADAEPPSRGPDPRKAEAERQRLLAAAPYADRLKSGPFTADLLRQAMRIGHSLRTKVHMAWLGTTLRLEARERRLELRPTAAGVIAVFIENNEEKRTRPVDLDGNAEALVREWLGA